MSESESIVNGSESAVSGSEGPPAGAKRRRFGSLEEFLAHARNQDPHGGTPDPPGWIEARLAELTLARGGAPVTPGPPRETAFGCSCGHTSPDDCPYERGEGGP